MKLIFEESFGTIAKESAFAKESDKATESAKAVESRPCAKDSTGRDEVVSIRVAPTRADESGT